MKPLISVITISYNELRKIEGTIISVINQTYENIEYIIIDGNSHDGTAEIIKQYIDKISFFLSEPDLGIYDAMNKGIFHANGEWIIFLNAGDVFNDCKVLENIFSSIKPPLPTVIYSDVIVQNLLKNHSRKLICDYEKLVLNHQCVIYKKKLHLKYGNYIVAKNFSIADYLFFNLIKNETFYKYDQPISIVDNTGISSKIKAFYKKITIDYLLENISSIKFIIIFFLYPIYRFIKYKILKK